ncbi:mediator of RNA polymerase II transcription subunit 28 isoform X3 [Gopherus flavomarginatus]|uniref:mediator of RNA polymerase II transcription subunit 28 isoform X3 n=1 Tax=Gopherus flavomarginatus TaxID=286002 RepID=UPI0021CBB6E5|nr:mediator of RNA polymerase II transcription subunit 28 isoform X3 [Gopherus flavomarginatus]
MAAALSGMFTNQPPGAPPPPLPPGGPGQAGLLPASAGPRNPNSTLVDELEASFEACFASLVSQDYVNGTDQEEIRTGVDQCIQKFLDVARQTECFFLQKRLHLSVQKPELVIKEPFKIGYFCFVIAGMNIGAWRNKVGENDEQLEPRMTHLRKQCKM